jgi:multidrug resistance protein MdtO
MTQSFPAVDEGNPNGVIASVRRLLSPTPGRLGNTIRLMALVLTSVTLSEVFRMPDAGLSAYIVLFVSKDEAASTILGSVISGVAVVVAVLATIMVFMISLSEPALRVPLIAIMTFIAMFLSRASRLGPVFFAAGFIIAYALTLGDEVLQISLAPEFASNVSVNGFALPELAFIPPEEALVHSLLWLAAAVAMPVSLVVVANFFSGRDPAVIWRAAMAQRFAAASRFCSGEPGSRHELSVLAQQGTTKLAKLAHLAGLLHKDARGNAAAAALTREMGRLCLVLLAWARVAELRAPDPVLFPAAEVCRHAGLILQSGAKSGTIPLAAITIADAGAKRPLAIALQGSLNEVAAQLSGVSPNGSKIKASAAPSHLLAPDAFSNPAYARFAFKVTLAVMFCYLGESLADWPGIHTCIITCFFVSLDTVGETIHKAFLRVAGCLVGAALGLATILLLMPAITDLGELLAIICTVTFLAGWVANGSERISYAGWQIAIAFYLTVLQGFGPTLDMETARDRIIGILVGDIVVFAIFTTIWPVKVADAVRQALARGLEQLAGLMAPAGLEHPAAATIGREAGEAAFLQTLEQASALLVNDPYEHSGSRRLQRAAGITGARLMQIEALIVPVGAILLLQDDPAWLAVAAEPREAVISHHRAMNMWLKDCASWVRGNNPGMGPSESLPQPPAWIAHEQGSIAEEHCAERAAWYGMLHDDIVAILHEIAPRSGAEAA